MEKVVTYKVKKGKTEGKKMMNKNRKKFLISIHIYFKSCNNPSFFYRHKKFRRKINMTFLPF